MSCGKYHPVDKVSGERLTLHLDKGQPGPKPCLVNDVDTGKVYYITRKDCGLGCQCDAWAEEVCSPENCPPPKQDKRVDEIDVDTMAGMLKKAARIVERAARHEKYGSQRLWVISHQIKQEAARILDGRDDNG